MFFFSSLNHLPKQGDRTREYKRRNSFTNQEFCRKICKYTLINYSPIFILILIEIKWYNYKIKQKSNSMFW